MRFFSGETRLVKGEGNISCFRVFCKILNVTLRVRVSKWLKVVQNTLTSDFSMWWAQAVKSVKFSSMCSWHMGLARWDSVSFKVEVFEIHLPKCYIKELAMASNYSLRCLSGSFAPWVRSDQSCSKFTIVFKLSFKCTYFETGGRVHMVFCFAVSVQ